MGDLKMQEAPSESGHHRKHLNAPSDAEWSGLTLDLVFHAETLPFDDDGLGMMQQPIQDRGGQGAIMVENRGPLLKSAVGGQDDRPLFIAQGDDLEEEIGAHLVNREVAELVEDEQRGFRVFF